MMRTLPPSSLASRLLFSVELPLWSDLMRPFGISLDCNTPQGQLADDIIAIEYLCTHVCLYNPISVTMILASPSVYPNFITSTHQYVAIKVPPGLRTRLTSIRALT